jgi:uncharacterized protein YbaP (TraB family)
MFTRLTPPFSRRFSFRYQASRTPLALAFLALFAALSMSAAAAETTEPTCQGTDLLAAMRKSDPKAYAQIIAEGKKIPNAKGLFWKIEKRGQKPSWLFGTMHVSDPRVLKLSPATRRAFLGAKVLVLESDQLLDLGKARLLAFTKPDMMMMPAGKRIEDFLTEDQKQLVNSTLTAKGAPLSAVNYLRPWLVANIAGASCKSSPEATARKGVAVLDQQLALEAVKRKLPIKGLETVEEQYGAINSMSLEAQIKGLLEAITSAKQLRDIDETTVELYKAGDLRPLSPLLRRFSRDDKAMPADAYAEFESVVIIKRNHTMAERAAAYLAEGNAFVAVGALHLQGEEGLVELFRKQGFKVTRVN